MILRFIPMYILRFLVILPAIIVSSPAMAHHLGVFAYSSGPDIVVTASFGHNRPIVKGKVRVTNNEGKLLFQGTTDTHGRLRFPRPAIGPKDKLVITVQGGPGHQGTWTMTREDLGATLEPDPADNTVQTDNPASLQTSSLSRREQQDLARLVSEAVAREIEPLKAMMAKQMDSGQPSLKNIIGGIGWLVGLGGLFAAWTSRKNRKGKTK